MQRYKLLCIAEVQAMRPLICGVVTCMRAMVVQYVHEYVHIVQAPVWYEHPYEYMHVCVCVCVCVCACVCTRLPRRVVCARMQVHLHTHTLATPSQYTTSTNQKTYLEWRAKVVQRRDSERRGECVVQHGDCRLLSLLIWNENRAHVASQNARNLIPQSSGAEGHVVARVETVPKRRHCEAGEGAVRGRHALVDATAQPVGRCDVPSGHGAAEVGGQFHVQVLDVEHRVPSRVALLTHFRMCFNNLRLVLSTRFPNVFRRKAQK